jgi:hypothetical protein
MGWRVCVREGDQLLREAKSSPTVSNSHSSAITSNLHHFCTTHTSPAMVDINNQVHEQTRCGMLWEGIDP